MGVTGPRLPPTALWDACKVVGMTAVGLGEESEAGMRSSSSSWLLELDGLAWRFRLSREVSQRSAAASVHVWKLWLPRPWVRSPVVSAGCPRAPAAAHSSAPSHAVNLLGNLPLRCLDVLLTLEPHEGCLEFLGANMDVVGVLLAFLEKRLLQVGRALLSRFRMGVTCSKWVGLTKWPLGGQSLHWAGAG